MRIIFTDGESEERRVNSTMSKKQAMRGFNGMRRLGRAVLLCLFLCTLFFQAAVSEEEAMTGDQLTEKLLMICEEKGYTDGSVWEPAGGTDQTASAAFADYLGKLLFNPDDPEEEWEKLITAPLVKAKGLRAGDILCCGGHSAMILSVTPLGEIRTIECSDEAEHRISVDGYFAGKAENATFTGIAEGDAFEYVLRCPGNTSEPVWSARLAALPEEPVIIGATYPVYLSNDQHFGLRGTVACKYRMTEIRAKVINRVTQETIFDVAVQPDANTYLIGKPTSETINDQLVFNSPECANSWLNYSLTVTYEKEGNAFVKEILSKDFKVGSPLTEEP